MKQPCARIRSAAAVVAVTVALAGHLATPRAQTASPPAAAANPAALCADSGVKPGSSADNGIAVGAPKIFDNRSLALKLDVLNASLRDMQFTDAAAIERALYVLQGYQRSDVSRSFQLQGPGSPQVVETVKQGQEASSGSTFTSTSGATTTPSNTTLTETTTGQDALKQTAGSEVQTTTAARASTIPALAAALNPPAFEPKFGMSASDLLGEQMNITYERINYEMLLERALSDRLYDSEARLQAVLGFNVSLTPPRDAQNSAAFVEVTIRQAGAPSGPVSLVALMPKEKTYNSAAVSTKSNAFGGSAVMSSVSLGYAEQRRSQDMYLFRDNDTVAFERMGENGRDTTFGWMFRPVLGRPTVAPGARQLFAVIAMPKKDVGTAQVGLEVEVKTYWQPYNRRFATSSDRLTFWQEVRRTASLGLAFDPPPGGRVSATACVEVPTTTSYQDDLKPAITSLTWYPTDSRSGVLSIVGKNFFQGTTIRIGGESYETPRDGLNVKSAQAIDLVLPIAALTSADGVMLGRYGAAIPLAVSNHDGLGSAGGIKILEVASRPALGGRHSWEIQLETSGGGRLTEAHKGNDAIVAINGIPIPRPYHFSQVTTSTGKVVDTLVVYPSTDAVKAPDGLLTVRYPFRGPAWQSSLRIYDAAQVYSVTRRSKADTAGNDVRLLISTADTSFKFTDKWAVLLDKRYEVDGATLSLHSDAMLELAVPSATLERFSRMYLAPPGGSSIAVAIPPAVPGAVELKITATSPRFINQHDARRVELTGQGFAQVAKVTADGEDLAYRRVSATQLDVFLQSSLTKEKKTLTILLWDDRGAVIGSTDVDVR